MTEAAENETTYNSRLSLTRQLQLEIDMRPGQAEGKSIHVSVGAIADMYMRREATKIMTAAAETSPSRLPEVSSAASLACGRDAYCSLQ